MTVLGLRRFRVLKKGSVVDWVVLRCLHQASLIAFQKRHDFGNLELKHSASPTILTSFQCILHVILQLQQT